MQRLVRGFLAGSTMPILAVLIALILGSGCQDEGASAFFKKGESQFRDGKYDEAIASYEQGLELEPDSAVGYNLLGMAYRMKYNSVRTTEWKQKEIEAFRRAIQADSTFWQAKINLGATYYYIGRKAEAAPLFRSALELYPDNPEREQLEQFIREGEEGPPGSPQDQ